jgi:hypothetical protein
MCEHWQSTMNKSSMCKIEPISPPRTINQTSTRSENFQKQTILFHSNKQEPNGNNIHSGTEGASTAAVKQRRKKS